MAAGRKLSTFAKTRLVQKSSIEKPAYQQIASPFQLGNQDRFGRPHAERYGRSVDPGPGSYIESSKTLLYPGADHAEPNRRSL